jgi:iron complex outermembrane recepter protein
MDRSNFRSGVSVITLCLALAGLAPAHAADAAGEAPATSTASDDRNDGAELVVTARRREEKLIAVPDSITAFSSQAIERTGIKSIAEFARFVPNLTYRNQASYSAAGVYISMRGIGNGQAGWPSVAFLIDGVPLDSQESIGNAGLVDMERIEVLRGPQSAVYGANAIAGAINIVTKQPSNEWEGRVVAEYADGNDLRIGGAISGPLVKDKLAFRIQAQHRQADGLIKSASNGLDLAQRNDFSTRASLLFTPDDRLTMTLTGEYEDTVHGAVYQSKIPTRAQIDDFSDAYRPRRRLAGREDHDGFRFSLNAQYDFGGAELVSVTSYSQSHNNLDTSVCYDDPDNPAVDNNPLPGVQVTCSLSLVALGSRATQGQIVDVLFLAQDDFKTFYQDLRLQSNDDGRFRWMFGGSYLSRNALNGFDLGPIFAPAAGGAQCAVGYKLDFAQCGAFDIRSALWHKRVDHWWGAYAQLSYDIVDKLELTLAGRYDRQRYYNTQYSSQAQTTIVQVRDVNGNLIDRQENKGNNFQPKVQLSYKPTGDFTAYATFSKGFRAGYYNTGNFAIPEKTTNYEVGAKTAFRGDFGILTASVAAFHIDYSNQQFSRNIPTPPFRVTTSVPKTNIDGAELELNWMPSSKLSLGLTAGYLDAKIVGGARSVGAPKLTMSANANYRTPITDKVDLILHGDWNHSSSTYLNVTAPYDIRPTKDYANLRAGVAVGPVTITGFVENLTDENEAPTSLTASGNAFVRNFITPRRYGALVEYRF